MKREKKEEKILIAALRHFSRFGYRKTSLEDIARDCDMTTGNIYFYVKNKEELYIKAVSMALLEWQSHAANAIAGYDDIGDKFRIMATASFDYVIANEELRSLLQQDPDIYTITPREDRFRDINLASIQIIRNVLQEGIAEGSFQQDMDLDGTADFIWSVYVMFLIRAYHKNEETENISRIYKRGVEVILRGLLD